MRQPGEVYWVVLKFHEYWGTSLEDDENSGRPSTTIPLKTAKQLQEFRDTIKEVADTVNVSNGLLQALHMIKSTLDMHCLCNQFLPWLSPPSRGSTVLKSAETMSRMITGDKSTGGYNLEKNITACLRRGRPPWGRPYHLQDQTGELQGQGRSGARLKLCPSFFFDFVRSYTVKSTLKDALSDWCRFPFCGVWERTFGGNNLNCGAWELTL